ncbi:hypothetical protein QBC40DRAFT_313513 [Triangularia verruculosa]|uniref:Uncharacterized protein n=1 Tax=Triangularia verruculosa TaxID=2587418 RepID=A0AAN7AZ96_9PEZI|nr:hypothetical protein QBC40DRAFT_313513 [Triangularia verruculosa]
MAMPLRTRDAPRPQAQSHQASGSNMMPPPGSIRHGNAFSGMPPPSTIDRRYIPWGQMTPGRSPQGHPGVHYGPIPVQGTPQDRFRREVLGQGRGQIMGSGQWSTPAPTPTLSSIRNSGPLQPNTPQPPSGSRQSVGTSSTAPQRLSHACQKRGFNPLFEVFPSGSKFGCNVNIGGTILRSGSLFETNRQAKEESAMKGLEYLRQRGWLTESPSPSKNSRDGTRSQASPIDSQGRLVRSQSSIAYLEQSVARLEATVARLQAPEALKREQDVEMTDVPASSGSRASAISAAQQVGLLEQIKRITGMDGLDTSSESAEVTRAYLEGLAVGSRLAAAARRRSRSPTRSPQTSRANRRRERSPLDARVRFTPPPVYERWTGRPATDRYRPEDRYRPDEDGRLRDNTRPRVLGRDDSESAESGEVSEHSSGRESVHGADNSDKKRCSSQP